MKIISLFLTSLIYSLHAFCQQPVIDTAVTNGMEQLSAQSFTSISRQQFDNVSLTGIGYSYYRKGNMLFYYRNSKGSQFDKFTLEENMNQFKKSHEDAGSIVTRSEIITVNGVRFLVIDFTSKSDRYLSFRSDYATNDKFTYGYIQYKSQDENKAQQLLNNVLQHIHLNNL
jgi:hypothetical protein